VDLRDYVLKPVNQQSRSIWVFGGESGLADNNRWNAIDGISNGFDFCIFIQQCVIDM
jgi:hypothetical protein